MPTQIRQAGGVTYHFTRKKVKNINLRVNALGQVLVSAGARVPLEQVDAFVAKNAQWVIKTLAAQAKTLPPAPPPQECQQAFEELTERMRALVIAYVPQPVTVQAKEMKSRWGVCHINKGKIVLNTRLATAPVELQEYVVLHELVHFAHPNHGPGFHAEMARLMPDYKTRRKALRT